MTVIVSIIPFGCHEFPNANFNGSDVALALLGLSYSTWLESCAKHECFFDLCSKMSSYSCHCIVKK